jgi:hypothetical protein
MGSLTLVPVDVAYEQSKMFLSVLMTSFSTVLMLLAEYRPSDRYDFASWTLVDRKGTCSDLC